MFRTATACAVTAALVFAVVATTGLASHRVRAASPFVPPCPHASYGADGNMGPLFCVIDNPVALRYFAPMARRTFALGRDATPSQVATALVTDYKRGAGTAPILCSIYQLAVWRNHWSFGVSAAANAGVQLHFPDNWCAEPKFRGVG